MKKTSASTTQAPIPSPQSRWPISSTLLNCLLVAVVAAAAFWPALSASFIWDDAGHVTRPDLLSLGGLWRIWFEIGATQQYYPVVHSAFWVEHHLWGDSTVGYHAINILWHACSACLFGLVLRRLAVPGAWFAALLFAVHPVCVESVAWVSEQKNTLSLLLYLAAALAYLRYEQTRRSNTYLVATALFVLAVLSKSVTATLPAALLVIAWWKNGRLGWKRDVSPLLPWFVLGIAGGLLTAWFEATIIGANGEAFALGPLERLLLASRAVWFYFTKLLWPHPLVFIYPRWNITVNDWTLYPFLIALALALIALLILAVKRERRGPLAIALLFCGTLFPALGFVNVFPFLYSFVADHFQYHASLSMIAALAALLSGISDRFSRQLRFAAVGVLLLLLGSLSWFHSQSFMSEFSLWEATLARNPASWMAHNNLGIALVNAGQAPAAIEHYREALKLRPDYAEGENNLGYALGELGRHAEALPHLKRALELRPNYLQARNNLAVALEAGGRADEGLAVLRETLRLYPNDSDAHFNLGLALARLGRTAEAQAFFERAAKIRPDDGKYVLHVGIALMVNGRFEEAEPLFRRALELDPNSASANYTFASALSQHGRPGESVQYYEEALRLQPTFPEAHIGLAEAFRALGRLEEAQYHFTEAQRR